jgi:hypothetical protein
MIYPNIIRKFPAREKVLAKEYQAFDNFFPIATIDLSPTGIRHHLHIIYTFLDPVNTKQDFSSPGDTVDDFSFIIQEDGLHKPAFGTTTLTITNKYEQDFGQFIEKCKVAPAIAGNKSWSIIEFEEEPEWIQGDETPLNSKGQPMKFICQVDLWDIIECCWMYVFFDSHDNIVRTIYQRT